MAALSARPIITRTNRGKRSIAIDFATPKGQDAGAAAGGHADVVIENFKVGGLEEIRARLCVACRQLNPRLVYCSITGFGQNGP